MSEKIVNLEKLDHKQGSYYTGKFADAVSKVDILRKVRMRRRQLGRMTQALDYDTAKRRVPSADYQISRKIDGEFTCLVYEDGEVFTVNPGGTVRAGADFMLQAAEKLKAVGIKQALFGGELYVVREDGERPRVHDVVRVARAPSSEEEVSQLAMGVFNVYELEGEDFSMRYAEAIEKVESIFGVLGGDTLIHSVETVHGNEKAVFEQYKKWVVEENAEGVVIRSDSAGVYKIKPRHTLDLVLVGFSEGIDDRAGMLHSLLLGIVRDDGNFQIISRVGGGFTDEQRISLLKQLKPMVVESEFAEVNSDRVAYQMIEPGLVVEISCLDIISRTSHGNTINRMILDWNEEDKRWEGVSRLPLCSIISPQFLRIRDDKKATVEDVKLSQLTDITEIPDVNRVADDLLLPESTVLERLAATKVLREATMVRKLMVWKTNKEEVAQDFPAYVMHLTDYSPNRKDPLKHEIRISSSKDQIFELYAEWQKKYIVGGWKLVE